MKTDRDQARVTGLALIVGGALFFTFWIFPATESQQGLIGPWPLQVAFHGAQIVTLATGFIRVARLPVVGWPSYPWRIGMIAATVGVAIGFPLFVAGILLIGVGAAATPGFRVAAVPLIPGALLWAALMVGGGTIGNSDKPPLDETQQILAVSGLVLIVTGLMLLGAVIWHAGRSVATAATDQPAVGDSSQSTIVVP